MVRNKKHATFEHAYIGIVMVHIYTYAPTSGVGVVNGQPLPSTQYTRAAPALPGGGEVDVGNVGIYEGPCGYLLSVCG